MSLPTLRSHHSNASRLLSSFTLRNREDRGTELPSIMMLCSGGHVLVVELVEGLSRAVKGNKASPISFFEAPAELLDSPSRCVLNVPGP